MASENPDDRDVVDDFGDFPVGSPVTEMGRWCQDSTLYTEGRHDIFISHDFDHGWIVAFRYPYMSIRVVPDIIQVEEDGELRDLDRKTPELAGQEFTDRSISGTVSQVEFVEATNTVLTLRDFNAE